MKELSVITVMCELVSDPHFNVCSNLACVYISPEHVLSKGNPDNNRGSPRDVT